ncbi:cytochrome c oxidase assembly protein [Sporichthya polymorpha]|uniref:cytochrome c oxidase assembly protein n=1 Tax=Sporichthya polymorpha TaxID=35751 RepID=UPI001FE0A71E|nr:cytochrome c oxidase assembly protein [Sporichthya polymorpha]
MSADLEPLTSTTAAWRGWTTDWPMLAVAVGLSLAYLAGVHRAKRLGARWPWYRTAAFLSGTGSLVLITHSFLGAYADTLFWARATMVSAVFIVVPLLLALGMPLSLVAAGMSPSHRRAAADLLRSSAARRLGHPFFGAALFLVLPWIYFFSPWFEATLRHEVADVLSLTTLLFLGFVYYWTRLQLDPVPARYPQLLSMFIGMGEVIANAALGLALITGGGVIAPDFYAEVARDWGPTLAMDQKIGGGWYWLVGHIAGIPFIIIAFWLARLADAQTAREVDAVLDELHVDEGPMVRPWWESDPRFTHLRTGGRPGGAPLRTGEGD